MNDNLNGQTPSDHQDSTSPLDHGIAQNPDTPGGNDTKTPPEPSISVDSSEMGCTKSKEMSDDVVHQDSSGTVKKSKSEDNEQKIKSAVSDDSSKDSYSKPSFRSKITITFDDSDTEMDEAGSVWAKRDIDDYRNGYPHLKSNSKLNDNYRFYKNDISSSPDGDFIDEIHRKWYGNYRRLEYHHGFIQWLFPLREQGLNWSAQPLQAHEIEKMQKDPEIMERLLKSFEMMLDFYGFEMVDRKTFKINRSSKSNYKELFDNLNTSAHNYLRITRILKCLGEFGFENIKFQFLVAVLREAILENTLKRCLTSCRDYWIETLRESKHRRIIRNYARQLIHASNTGATPPPAPIFEISARDPTMDSSDNQME